MIPNNWYLFYVLEAETVLFRLESQPLELSSAQDK
jgi:hypothetical protein